MTLKEKLKKTKCFSCGKKMAQLTTLRPNFSHITKNKGIKNTQATLIAQTVLYMLGLLDE